MKICDRHYYTDGSSVPSVDVLTFKIGGEAIDLCSSCCDAVKEFIFTPEKPVKEEDEKRDPEVKRRGRRPAGKN